jgi:hypothetical protein
MWGLANSSSEARMYIIRKLEPMMCHRVCNVMALDAGTVKSRTQVCHVPPTCYRDSTIHMVAQTAFILFSPFLDLRPASDASD